MSDQSSYLSDTPDQREKQRIITNAFSASHLELIVLPTEKCNFRCTYCYEDFAIGRMKPEVVTGLKALISSRAADLGSLHVSWFGGEPMLAYPTVLEVSELCQELQDQGHFSYQGSMTTNGYLLTVERALELYRSGVRRYQISLDGGEDEHNKTRLRVDGAGTFGVIWANLAAINDAFIHGEMPGLQIVLRVHAHPENIQSLLGQLAPAIKSCLSPRCMSISVNRVGHWGGPNDSQITVFGRSDDRFRTFLDDFSTELDEFFPKITTGPAAVCYACKGNSFVIRADGRLAKCTVALKDTANTVGTLTADGRLVLDHDRLRPWFHPMQTMLPADLACPATHLPRSTHDKSREDALAVA